MASNAVSASAKGATSLIMLQITSRAITFALNQLLLRLLSPTVLGISVQLELYKIGVQYFSRESLRVAAERRSDGGVQASVNLSWLAIAANVPLGFVFAEWYLRGSGDEGVPYFKEAVRICQGAAFVELLMEPAFTAVQHNMMYHARAVAEGLSVIFKTLTVFGLFFWGRKQGLDLGALPFAAGEMINSITLTAVYWSMTIPVAQEQGFSLFPRRMKSSPKVEYVFGLFSKPLLHLISSLFFQTGIKWLLTEGDKLLITSLASLEDQGMYALAANYGGLIARMIFQPIEISSRNLFANLCAVSSPQAANGTPAERKTSSPQANENLTTASNILTLLLRSYSLLSLLCFSLGPSAAPLLLRLIAGSRWNQAGSVLGTYCYYIPFLAINGVSEAFVAATASTKDLRDQSFWMAGFSVLFAGSAWFFLKVLGWGAQGLVLANCVNMGLRVMFNFGFVKSWFGERNVNFNTRDILPDLSVTAIALGVSSMLSSNLGLAAFQSYGVLGELARISAVGAVLAAVIAASERNFLMDCYRRFTS